ncbi:metal ABC transporter solute-binding protein, Zn/Mn family [Mycobacterium sp. M23085]|uniref:metal ABC transporter solute-binding protein, Zn/Mn family n=1 Tax=Mycobacterium sp. M23085 TaxID=3378087 RepID=UPI003877A76F
MTARTRRCVTLNVVAVLSAVALTLVGCSHSPTRPPPGSATQLKVVAAENFWGDIAKQIGGDHVQVTSVISDPNADPHLYESDARTAAAVSAAQLVIVNGLGYDDFMAKMLSASPNSDRKVLTAADVMQISGADANPHIWYDIAKLPQVSSAIAAQLGALDPAEASTFSANAKTFSDSLAPTDAAIANIKTKYSGAPVGYTERVPGYLVDAAGLKLATPPSFAQAIEDGNDPSPADNSAMDTAVKTKAIKVLLYNAQVTSPATNALKTLAQQSGVPIVGVTETLPTSDANFQAWQLRQVNELTSALGK